MLPKDVLSGLITGKNFDYLLFKIAIYFAECGLNVWYVRPSCFEQVPNNIEPPEREVLESITFIYLKDYIDLSKHLNGIHMWRTLPNIIIMSNIEHYCQLDEIDYNPSLASMILSTLLDGALYCSNKLKSKILLLATYNQGQFPERMQKLVQLYFTLVFDSTNTDACFSEITEIVGPWMNNQ